MKNIPVRQMKDKGFSTGLELHRFVRGDKTREDVEQIGIHRDDHYLFFLMEEGSATMMIDFHEITFSANMLHYVLPGQVHQPLKNNIAAGWFIAVDPLLIPLEYRNVFETQTALQQPFMLQEASTQQCRNLLDILYEKYIQENPTPFHQPVLNSLLQSFIGMVASCYCGEQQSGSQLTRPAQLFRKFKMLLGENFSTIKSPSAYAAKLNVTEAYLNEALKKATGFSVSHWIIQEVMLEAKRLLYYSQLNVKEIAHQLGYEDHTYFSRLFKKTTGKTPLLFRQQYHK